MKIKGIELTVEKETLFITLYAKALDYRSKHSLLHDKMADDIIKSMDADFSQYKSLMNLTPVRARQYDDWVREFIVKEPDGAIVYLGCGMDTRVYRVDPPESIAWYDVDFPEVIELRKAAMPPRESYHMIASSMTEENWLMQIPASRPSLIIAEGSLEYLNANDVKILFDRIIEHFQHGRLIFDIISTFAAASGKDKLKETTGAVHKWVVDDISDVDKMNEKMRRDVCMPAFKSPCVKELSAGARLLCRLFSMRPKYRDMIRILSYSF